MGDRFFGRLFRYVVALTLGATLLVVIPTTASAQGSATVGGTVTEADGTPVEGVKADLFETAGDGSRGQFLGTTRTGADGAFTFAVDAGCYTITVIAPDGRTFNSRRWFQPSLCVQNGEVADALRVVVDPIPDSSIGGTVTYDDGSAVALVKIDLFRSNGRGGRADFLTSVRTADDGTYAFDVSEGCYVLTFIAPDGTSFNGSRWSQPTVCVDKDNPAVTVDAVVDRPSTGGSGLGGQVTDADDDPVEDVKVTLYEAGADGSRGAFLGPQFTGADGRYAVEVEPGCYFVIFVAPDGESFNGGRYLERRPCVDPGQVRDDVDAVLDGRGDPETVTVSIGDGAVQEGATGEETVVELALTLSGPSTTEVSVDVAVTGGTAIPGEDFRAADGTVSFPAGTTAATFPITVLGDDLDEGNETVAVTLVSPSAGLTVDDGTGELTIVDDDGPVGDPPTVDDQRFSVSELSPVGTGIGTVVVGNAGPGVSFALDDNSEITIDPATGELTVVDPLAMAAGTTIGVQVTVTNGGGSDTAAITVDVTRIDTLPNPNSTTTSTGGTLEVEITGPPDRTGVPGGPLTIQGLAGVGGTTAAATVTYTIDVSGSTSSGGNDCNGDGVVDAGDNFNPGVDSSFGTVLDCEIAGILALNRSLAGAPVEVSLVVFGSSAAAADVGPADGEQVFTTPTADADGNGIADIEEVLASVRQGGINSFIGRSVGTGTDFGDALTAVTSVQAQRSAGRSGFVFFLSDGRSSVSDTVIQGLADEGVIANTYSVGATGTGCAESASLRRIADGTTGTCVEVDDPSGLTAALTEGPQQGVEAVLVSIDGGPPVEATLNALGQWTVDVAEVSVDRHIIRATARATDGTEVAAEILVVRVS